MTQPIPIRLQKRVGRVAHNAGWNMASQIWLSVLNLVVIPIIIRRLGAEPYGVLTMLTVVTNYVWFMDLGLGQATVKYVAENSSRSDWATVRRVFWTSATGYVVLGT